MKISPNPGARVDTAAVRRYFDRAGGGNAASAGFMAHAQNLPRDAVNHRLVHEQWIIRDWLEAVPPGGNVLDLGCGAGVWTEIFARRFARVIGMEHSASMLRAARARLAPYPRVHLLQDDIRNRLPEGPFQLVFFGGMCMYLNDDEVLAVLRELQASLAPGATIILRESCLPGEATVLEGDYQAVYRGAEAYASLFRAAGYGDPEVRRNWGYFRMELAVELVNLRRRFLPFLPVDSPLLGALTWFGLKLSTPLSFWLLPRMLDLCRVAWPPFRNNFYRLLAPHGPTAGHSPRA